MTNCTTV